MNMGEILGHGGICTHHHHICTRSYNVGNPPPKKYMQPPQGIAIRTCRISEGQGNHLPDVMDKILSTF